jgi:hypothetical protein
MLPVKNYTLTETAQTIDLVSGGDFFHVKNNGENRALLAYFPESEPHDLAPGEDGVVALEAGEMFHYSVIPSWELVGIGNGEISVMTTAENTSPFDGAASANVTADGGDWDITHTYRKSQPHLWVAGTEIDWGDGSFSAHLTTDSQRIGDPLYAGIIVWDDTYYAHAEEVDKIICADGYITRTDNTTGVKTGRSIYGYFTYVTTPVRGTAYGVGVEMYNNKKSIVLSYQNNGVYTNHTFYTDLYLTYTKIAAD